MEHDVVVIGTGVAGAAAAVAAAEADDSLDVAMVERAPEGEHAGNSRYTDAYMRLEADGSPAENFREDFQEFSNGKADEAVVDRIATDAKPTIDWLREHGVEFEQLETMFLTANRPRLLPVGGGLAIVDALLDDARDLGVSIHFETTAEALERERGAGIQGLWVRDDTGSSELIETDNVVIACGGFEGNPQMLAEYVEGDVTDLPTIAPGGEKNMGEGIRMATDVGAATDGQFKQFHAEPIDPRCDAPEAAIMAFPYGILVNKHGERFVDEGGRTVDEHYEYVSRRIREQPDGRAYLIADQKIFDVPKIEHSLQTTEDPIEAEPDYAADEDPLVTTVENLGAQIDVDTERLFETVSAYNDAINDAEFDPFTTDGKAAAVDPPKSNWAQALDTPPLVCWPMQCSIVMTFGGVATDDRARVVNPDGRAIPGLYAAGEVTGLYFDKYAGATSVLRGLVFGRLAGQEIASR
ncbi:MAG: FAD-binding protein [Salinirussus sp.]